MFKGFVRRFGAGWIRRGGRMVYEPSTALELETPQTISGLHLWYRADTGVSTTAGDVDTWAPKVGTGTMAPPADAPSLNATDANFNNEPTVDFEGTAVTRDYLTFTPANPVSSLTEGETFIVLKRNNDPPTADYDSGLWKMDGHAKIPLVPWSSNSVLYDGWGSTARRTTTDPTTSFATSAILYNVFSATNDFGININGASHYTDGTNTVSFSNTPSLGASAITTHVFDGQIAEWLIYDNKLSTGDRDTIESYLSDRYSLGL